MSVLGVSAIGGRWPWPGGGVCAKAAAASHTNVGERVRFMASEATIPQDISAVRLTHAPTTDNRCESYEQMPAAPAVSGFSSWDCGTACIGCSTADKNPSRCHGLRNNAP